MPLWFAPEAPRRQHDVLSFHRSNDFDHVGAEVQAQCASGVGISEIANFAKYEADRGGAPRAFLNHLMTNSMPREGRIILTPMLNPAGQDHRRFHHRPNR